MQSRTVFVLLAAFTVLRSHADWPTLRGNAARSGFVDATFRRPTHLAFAVEFENERLGTAMEPIVANGRLYVATHAGNLYALKAETGQALWRFAANGPFLHSPAVAGDRAVAASTDGSVYGLEAATGKLAWNFFGGRGGFSASPTIADGLVFLGSRDGQFFALDAQSGKAAWRQTLGAPIRQTAAFADGALFVTSEDLRVHALAARDGKLLWASEPLVGQTARDYYPIIVKQGERTFVVVRTNPILNMGQRIGRDRTMLCRSAGVDDSGWQKVDAWIKSGQRGNPELWAREQTAIVQHLESNGDAQTFFVLDAKTGKRAATPPVLWIAGCQAVGAEPALTSDGRLLVFYRSVYGNWNHGVAPLVALGLLDLARNKITPLFHQQGNQPRWNAFWGTADESQNFLVVGQTALIVHQGTLSGFDLEKNELFTIFGERDRYGGYRNPGWARNEWHGPGRGGVAVAGHRLYWQTGSRILCLNAGDGTKTVDLPKPQTVRAAEVVGQAAPVLRPVAPNQIAAELASAVRQVIATNWAPLFTDPGLAGRDFSFDESGELFESVAWAYPHLAPELQKQARAVLEEQWRKHPPFTREGWYSLKEGAPREWFWIPGDFRARLGGDKQPSPFAGVYPAWLFAERCGEKALVLESWPALKAAFEAFDKSGWKLDGAKGDLFANRYLSSLIAFGQLAESAGDAASARQAKARANDTVEALVSWWKRAADRETLKTFNTSAQLDPFIGKGDGLSFAVAPHRHKLALLQDLTPEIAALIRARAPGAVERLWETFDVLYRTWSVVGEERQVHFGENFVDPPDLALNGFKALAWLRGATHDELARRVDLPFGRADLYHVTKLALTLEAGR